MKATCRVDHAEHLGLRINVPEQLVRTLCVPVQLEEDIVETAKISYEPALSGVSAFWDRECLRVPLCMCGTLFQYPCLNHI